jgi:drug/metabolite transporter (DMT)-like permease
MTKQTWAYLGLLVANIAWGAGASVSKATMAVFPPALLSALQIAIASVVLLVIQWRGKYPAILPQDRWPMAGLSVVMNVAGFILGYVGIALSLASDISLLVIGEVIFTAFLARWLLREHIDKARWLSIFVGGVGAVILITGSLGHNTATAPNRVLGGVLFLLDLLCCAYYTVRGGVFLARNNTVSMMTYVNVVSMFFWGPVLVYYIASGQFPVVTTASVIGLLYQALVTSVLCIFLSFYAVKIIGATATTIVLFVQPLVGALVGVLVLGDPVTLSRIIGAVFVFGSIGISMRAQLREARV